MALAPGRAQYLEPLKKYTAGVLYGGVMTSVPSSGSHHVGEGSAMGQSPAARSGPCDVTRVAPGCHMEPVELVSRSFWAS